MASPPCPSHAAKDCPPRAYPARWARHRSILIVIPCALAAARERSFVHTVRVIGATGSARSHAQPKGVNATRLSPSHDTRRHGAALQVPRDRWQLGEPGSQARRRPPTAEKQRWTAPTPPPAAWRGPVPTQITAVSWGATASGWAATGGFVADQRAFVPVHGPGQAATGGLQPVSGVRWAADVPCVHLAEHAVERPIQRCAQLPR